MDTNSDKLRGKGDSAVVLGRVHFMLSQGNHDIHYQAPVVQRMDNAIHRINHYPVDKRWQNKLHYPLDSDLSDG